MSNILHSQGRGDVLSHVSGNLRRLRQMAGLSQVALAKASGISRRMIVGVEGGDTNISLSSLDKLAGAMGVGFVDLVRDPGRASSDINELSWRGKGTDSTGVLLGTAPAANEAQLWLWSMSPEDNYVAERDPVGWYEMIFVIDGVLTLVLNGHETEYAAGSFAIYSSAQDYAYLNRGPVRTRFIRNVIS